MKNLPLVYIYHADAEIIMMCVRNYIESVQFLIRSNSEMVY